MKKDRLLVGMILLICAASLIIGVLSLFKREDVQPKESRDLTRLLEGPLVKKEGIAIVKIYGVISLEQEADVFGFQPRGADYIVSLLDRYRKNEKVKAVILRVNSPGGTVGAAQEICDAIKSVQEAGKKVVVSMGDIAASGGYYIAAPADKILANSGTITGSIGVITAGLNLSELMKKHGIKVNVIKSGQNKDTFAYWRDMTEGERALMEELVQNIYQQFLNMVSEGRNIPLPELHPLADGRIFSGEQAVRYNLVDQIGGLKEAIKITAELVGLDPEDVTIIKERESYWEELWGRLGVSFRSIENLTRLFPRNSQGYLPVLYMYYPPSQPVFDNSIWGG